MAKPLSQEQRAALIASSRKAAAAFLEDIAFLREAIEKPTDAAEVRRLSSVLRRLLVEGDIHRVAAPRVGKIKIPTPDNSRYYALAKKRPWRLFVSGGAEIFGLTFEGTSVEETPNAVGATCALPATTRGQPAAPRNKIDLPLDKFLSQNVLYLNGSWVSRSAAIKYVANVSSGVHSGAANEPDEKVLSQISHNNQISFDKDKDQYLFNLGYFPQKEFSYSPKSIDVVLVELLAAARFIVEARDIINLENVVRQELISS